MQRAISLTLLVVVLAPSVQAESNLSMISGYALTTGNEKLIDARTEKVCIENALADAICLPTERFIGTYGRIANMRDIRWLLGALGLTGAETVIVFADDPQRRDTVTAVLYLAGQKKLIRVIEPVSRLLEHGGLRRGNSRIAALFRISVFEVPVRTVFLKPGQFDPSGLNVAGLLASYTESVAGGNRDPFLWPVQAAGQ